MEVCSSYPDPQFANKAETETETADFSLPEEEELTSDEVACDGDVDDLHLEEDVKDVRFQCANCSKMDFLSRKVTDFIFSGPNTSSEEIRLTVLEAVSEIFNIKLEPLIASCYEDIKLCYSCGVNLSSLYKCFKQFTHISAAESLISGLLKMNSNTMTMTSPGENETKKSLRKNPKQLIRYEITTNPTPSSHKRNSNKIQTKFSKIHVSTTAVGASFPSVLKEDFASDDSGEEEDVGVEDDVNDFASSFGPNAPSLDIGVTTQGQYHCLSCGKVFPTKAGIILHLGFKHNINKDDAQQQCLHPSIVEKTNKLKKSDRVTPKRKRKAVPREDRIPLPCPHCHKSSWNQRDLNNHISSVHMKIKPFLCPLCDKPFSRKQQVEAHLKVHSGEKTSLCFLCGKSYSSAGALKGHLDRHFPKSAPPPNPLRFKCNLCNVQCTDMRRLNEHKLRHQDERNFPCDHCEKAFKTRRDLVKHRNYHKLKLEKPEQCPACEKRYSTKEILKFHLHSTHHYSLEDARSAAGIGLAAVVVYDDQNQL